LDRKDFTEATDYSSIISVNRKRKTARIVQNDIFTNPWRRD
jgi:hypothetical protein